MGKEPIPKEVLVLVLVLGFGLGPCFSSWVSSVERVRYYFFFLLFSNRVGGICIWLWSGRLGLGHPMRVNGSAAHVSFQKLSSIHATVRR